MAYLKKTRGYDTIEFDHSTIQALGKPTKITRGVHEGFSLPVYNSDDEELFACTCIPADWDGVGNIDFKIGCWLDTANTDKKFQLRLSIACVDNGDIVGDTSADYDAETETGTASQYQFFLVTDTFNAVSAGCSAGDALGIRLRRIAATATEATGEVVVKGIGLSYPKLLKL